MSEDEKTNILLGEYEATAANLIKGVNVCPETMNRYHGITGQLLAHVIRSLWTQNDLKEQIENLIAEKCAKCERSPAVKSAAPDGRWYAVVAAITAVASALRPVAWPLVVLVGVLAFSPHAVEIARLVIDVCAKAN